jgi:hypothetical protein
MECKVQGPIERMVADHQYHDPSFYRSRMDDSRLCSKTDSTLIDLYSYSHPTPFPRFKD